MIDVSNKQEFIDAMNNDSKNEQDQEYVRFEKRWNKVTKDLTGFDFDAYNKTIDEYSRFLVNLIDKVFIETWIEFFGATCAKDIYNTLTEDFTIEKVNKINACIEAVNNRLSAYGMNYGLGNIEAPIEKSEQTLNKIEYAWNTVFNVRSEEDYGSEEL